MTDLISRADAIAKMESRKDTYKNRGSKIAINSVIRDVKKLPTQFAPAEAGEYCNACGQLLDEKPGGARTIDQIPPEGVRTKSEEWEAMYAALFRQMKPIMDENNRLKATAGDASAEARARDWKLMFIKASEQRDKVQKELDALKSNINKALNLK